MKCAKPLRVLIVDDHVMFREGLRVLLGEDPAVDVVGEAHDGRTAIQRTLELDPDLVVMDVGLHGMNGIEATRQIAREAPHVRVLALSAYSDRRYVLNMLEAGASGYVLKDAAADELRRGVEAVARGDRYLSPQVTSAVLDACLQRDARKDASAYSLLGAREREVLQLIAEGLTSTQIAERLSISPKTVETHRRNLTRKLDVRTIAGLTKYAVREGLTDLDR